MPQPADDIMKSKYPPSPPPETIPHYSGECADAAKIINKYLYNYIYLWIKNNGSFWMYPVCIKPCGEVRGYKWHHNDWMPVSLNTTQIESLY